MIRPLLLTLLLATTPTLAWSAEPTGHYTVAGKNPDGSTSYTGTAVVTKTGDTYKVVWSVDGDQYVGTAIGDEHFIAVSYKSGSDTGLALYGDKGDSWSGIWTYAGGKTLGTEVWTRE